MLDEHCDRIVSETALFRDSLPGADLRAPVPSCPDWDLNALLRHLGEAHRWIEATVAVPSDTPPPQDAVRQVVGHTDTDPVALGDWLAEGAASLAATLRAAGPDARRWVPHPSLPPTAAFHARRMANETVVHRADGQIAIGVPFVVGDEVAVGTVDEWMELSGLPMMFEFRPDLRELLGPGRTLLFEAVGGPSWLVGLTGDALDFGRAPAGATAAVTVRGTPGDLVLAITRRRPVADLGLTVSGDAELLTFWLDRVGFG